MCRDLAQTQSRSIHRANIDTDVEWFSSWPRSLCLDGKRDGDLIDWSFFSLMSEETFVVVAGATAYTAGRTFSEEEIKCRGGLRP
jgi:hypothetical protein